MSHLIVGSPNARGLATSAGTRESGLRTVSGVGALERNLAEALTRSQPSPCARSGAARDGTAGSGTSGLRCGKPTAFSTEPFSLLEYGLQ